MSSRHLRKVSSTHSSADNSIVSQKESKTNRRQPDTFFADSPAVVSLLKVTETLLRCASGCPSLSSVLTREPPEEQRDCFDEIEVEYNDLTLRQDYQLERA